MPQIVYSTVTTQLRIEQDGSHVLNVRCGKGAQAVVEFPLNDEECAEYAARGNAYVIELSLNVQKASDLYAARGSG